MFLFFFFFFFFSARDIGWSIIDVDYSPDGKFLAYSSWSNFIHMVRIDNLKVISILIIIISPLITIILITLIFYSPSSQVPDPFHVSHDMRPESRRFCLFSIKFSPNNSEILGGASDSCLYIYDLEAEQRTVQIPAHFDDINAG